MEHEEKTQRSGMKHKPQAQGFKGSALFASLLVCFWWRTLLILFLGSGGICPRKYCKGGLGEGGGKQWHRVLDQVGHRGQGEDTPERKKVRWSQSSVQKFRRGLEGAGRPYLMASVFSMTGWHLL